MGDGRSGVGEDSGSNLFVIGIAPVLGRYPIVFCKSHVLDIDHSVCETEVL